jgi:hypothetical protein
MQGGYNYGHPQPVNHYPQNYPYQGYQGMGPGHQGGPPPQSRGGYQGYQNSGY